jgi:predicted PurR-regulated permease PerM
MEFRAFIDRNWRYIFTAVLAALVLWALYAWRMTVLPFLLGLMMAYLFMAHRRFIERHLPGKNNRHSGAKRVGPSSLCSSRHHGGAGGVMFLAVTTILRTSTTCCRTPHGLLPTSLRPLGWVDSVSSALPQGLQDTCPALSKI